MNSAYGASSHLSLGDITVDNPAQPSKMVEGLQNRPILAGHFIIYREG